MDKKQFGFKTKCSTEDVFLIVRRGIEQACAAKTRQALLSALDWKKAFDSINVEGLLLALRRFGVPGFFLDVIKAIYSDRAFAVQDWCGC